MIILLGGLRLNELYDYLAALEPPLSFESVPSVDEQTIAGVCSKIYHHELDRMFFIIVLISLPRDNPGFIFAHYS